MTSLIFGSIYLGHGAIVNHRREKQRIKNYERWEGLRDEYDEQRKISRESRSLDIQRTGQDYTQPDRPILTLRDQQEANDVDDVIHAKSTSPHPNHPLIEVSGNGDEENMVSDLSDTDSITPSNTASSLPLSNIPPTNNEAGPTLSRPTPDSL